MTTCEAPRVPNYLCTTYETHCGWISPGETHTRTVIRTATLHVARMITTNVQRVPLSRRTETAWRSWPSQPRNQAPSQAEQGRKGREKEEGAEKRGGAQRAEKRKGNREEAGPRGEKKKHLVVRVRKGLQYVPMSVGHRAVPPPRSTGVPGGVRTSVPQ